MSPLIARWSELLPTAPALGEDLIRRWAAPGRHYHDLRHLYESLAALDALASPTPVEYLALWFHDAIHTNQPGLDEEASANFAAQQLAGTFASCEVTEICRLILLTVNHQVAPEDHSGARICDADLSILGAQPERYRQSVADLRREHHNLSDYAWRELRRQRLSNFLRAESPFHTSTGMALWGTQAHHNLSQEAAELSD